MTIAGSDPSGGAGLQADLKTFHQHGVYGMSVVTLLTVQNTQAVKSVELLHPEFVLAQLDAVLQDIPPSAVKTGALGNAEIIRSVAERVANAEFPLIVDPVMISKHGSVLIDDQAIETLRSSLLPHACLVTPNCFEASRLTGMNVSCLDEMERAAEAIVRMGARNVLVKGGIEGDQSVDLLYGLGKSLRFASDRLDTKNLHGTGCVLSAAITAGLASGLPLIEAIDAAKQFVSAAIRRGAGVGEGIQPVDFHTETRRFREHKTAIQSHNR
ncbi:Hydroxymethylpyrimidine/phosphomethylpyrimidine kinase [Planctomycetes bacterium CA13]|uniref:hydroxymethylpyrimidine kinase n=1 Tax=Novipirellula herctigrandis TaxID=2527986 RepID=A0A5C5Z4L2_9BACT|nr:Hydroxymethylpyrimidine/phosphomethylpyrimidine kinase [Planctomycetes bacterium CA13]